MEHTKEEMPKRPWTFLSFDLPTAIYIGTEQGTTKISDWTPEFNPCLDFIRKCVNSHDDLVTRMEHTEGKWETKEETDGHFGIYPQDGENCIAVVWCGEEPAEANARLIAAAPDLLAACEVAKEKLQNDTGTIDEALDKLEEAIAAAQIEPDGKF